VHKICSHAYKTVLSISFLKLNDVKEGGATVFPRIGAAVWPEKVRISFLSNFFFYNAE